MLILRRNLFWVWIAFLLVLIAAGLFAAFQVFTRGLIVTNLSDLAPWGCGLWLTFPPSP